MPVETAADLASMFDDEEFAEGAVYTGPEADAEGMPCSVIVDRGQGRNRFKAGDASASTSERQLWVQKAQLPTVVRDGYFEITDELGVLTGELYQVVGMPKLDETGKIWSADLVIVD